MIIQVLLFLSGFAALVYQTLWLRLLGLVFGVTVYAASTVLAAFMGGLALGSFLAGRLADRVRRPLAWFGIAEVLIAGSAFLTPLLLDALRTLYGRVYASVSDDLGLLTLVRFFCSFAVLMVPTTLMGATMPLALRASLARASEMGARASALYAANTAGALAGTLVTAYYLIGHVGIAGSFRVAAVCNLAAGLSALLWSESRYVVAREHRPAIDTGGRQLTSATRRLVLAVFAKQPLRLPLAQFRERLKDPAVASALKSAGIAGFDELTRLYTAGPDDLRRFLGDGPILTDDRPLVEFFLSLPQNEPNISLAGLTGDVTRHIVP